MAVGAGQADLSTSQTSGSTLIAVATPGQGPAALRTPNVAVSHDLSHTITQ